MNIFAAGFLRTALSLMGAGTVWLWGLGKGHDFDFESAGLYCHESAESGHRLTAVEYHIFLPSTVCHFADGTSQQLVPWFVLPLQFLLLAAAIYFAVTTMRKVNDPEQPAKSRAG